MQQKNTGPTVEEARAELAVGMQRMARGAGILFALLVGFVVVANSVRSFRLLSDGGIGEVWRRGGFSQIGEVLPLPLFAVAVWFGAPKVMELAYGILLREGRLVRATVLSGPAGMDERVDFVGPLVGILGAALPTQVVTYRIDGAPTQTGALYADETLVQDSGGFWALAVLEGTGRKAWLVRRRSR